MADEGPLPGADCCVNRLATASGLGIVWDFVRGHYAREAQEIAKREARRWYPTPVLSARRPNTFHHYYPSYAYVY